jgi:hypothetical protein
MTMKLGDKYLVIRRDGSVPSWPKFALGACDPAAPAALRAYADAAAAAGMEPDYCDSVRALADEFEAYRKAHGASDPAAPSPRVDDAAAMAAMKGFDCLIVVKPDRLK